MIYGHEFFLSLQRYKIIKPPISSKLRYAHMLRKGIEIILRIVTLRKAFTTGHKKPDENHPALNSYR